MFASAVRRVVRWCLSMSAWSDRRALPVPRARWSLLLVLLALLPVAEARAATTVKPDLQLACETLSPTYGGCNSSVLAISDEPGPGGTPVRSLVKFDTAGLNLPANAIIT